MKLWIFLLVAGCATLVTAQCPLCNTMKWGRCEQNGSPQCSCTLLTGNGDPVNIDCSTLCWCVNSAGVRRSDKGDKNINCTTLVETYWIRFQLTHKEVSGSINDKDLKNAFGAEMKSRYSLDPSLIDDLQYDPDARMIVMDVKKPKGERTTDLGRIAYYMEKDVKVLPLFYNDTNKFITKVSGQNVGMEKILVYYVDEVAPTFTMKNLSGGIIAVIVVVVLVVVLGLLLLFFYRRQQKKKYKKTPQRELDNM
uniref:receptor protein-tyrosine kinase n=1 Tax=Iconisemion striatum TaxID=60296 RepID=A0A1A7W9Y3_9TELE